MAGFIIPNTPEITYLTAFNFVHWISHEREFRVFCNGFEIERYTNPSYLCGANDGNNVNAAQHIYSMYSYTSIFQLIEHISFSKTKRTIGPSYSRDTSDNRDVKHGYSRTGPSGAKRLTIVLWASRSCCTWCDCKSLNAHHSKHSGTRIEFLSDIHRLTPSQFTICCIIPVGGLSAELFRCIEAVFSLSS